MAEGIARRPEGKEVMIMVFIILVIIVLAIVGLFLFMGGSVA